MNGFTKRTLLSSIGALALSLGIAAPLMAATPDEIKQAGKIRIGMDVALRPFAFRNDAGTYVGSDVTVAEMIAEDLGVDLEIVPLTSPNRIPYLVTDKVDIVISTLANTPERAEVIDFSKPYSGSFVVVSAPASMDLSSMEDLAGNEIAVTRGTTYDKIITEKAPDGTNIVRFDSEDTTLTAVSSGQMDIGAFNVARLKELQASSPDKSFEAKFNVQEVKFTIGVPKGADEMRVYLDSFIDDHMADGSLNAAFKEYLGVDLPASVTGS